MLAAGDYTEPAERPAVANKPPAAKKAAGATKGLNGKAKAPKAQAGAAR